jgi:integrase
MATEKVGIYRKWLEPAPKGDNGKPIPKSQWPKKRRHHWIARWYGTNRRYGKVFNTRKEAERYAAELQRRVCLGKADKPQKVALHDFRVEHEQLMSGQVAYGTLQEHGRALRLFEKFIGGSFILGKITPRHSEAFIAHRIASGLSPSTVNKDIATLKRVFNLAIEPRGYLAEGQNPFAKLKKRKIAQESIRYVTVEEYHAVKKEARKLWWKALISVAYGSGLRRNEILHLTWVDIDFEHQRIHVSPKKASRDMLEWEPKDHENRIVPMAEETSRFLVDLQTQAPEGHPYIFISPGRMQRIRQRQEVGDWTSRSQVINNMGRHLALIRTRADVAEFTLHDLRRSAITNWARELPIQVVQQLAGHSDISTTRKYYLAVRSEDLASANDVLNRILTKTREN